MNSKPSNVTSITDMQDEAIRLIDLAVSNLKCNTLTEGNVRKWERDTNTCSQKTE